MTSKIGLAGDWHGARSWAVASIRTFARAGVHDVYQLGDFGLGWPTGWGQYINEVVGACIKHDVYLSIVPGNHENYDWINARLLSQAPEDGVITISQHVRVLPRNYREKLDHNRTLLALGGAPSIDFASRLEGRDWWSEEMIKLHEAEKAAADGHADIMLTHDAPSGGTDEVQQILDANPMGWTRRDLKYAEEGRTLMEIAFNGVRPKVFAHGHFHVAGQKRVGDTQFLSLDMNAYGTGIEKFQSNAVLDLYDLSFEWLPTHA